MVLCESRAREMVAVGIPRKNTAGNVAVKLPTAVPLGCTAGSEGRYWRHCIPHFGTANEDHVLLLLDDYEHFFEIVLVDLVRTCSSKALAVLSSTVPRLEDLHLSNFGNFRNTNYFVLTQQSGVRSFVMESSFSPQILIIEEGTGRLQQFLQSVDRSDWWVSQLNESQCCVFGLGMDTYTVWDINDTRKPVRSHKCPRISKMINQCFVEGSLLFQMSESHTELHVTEESSGDHVISFQLFRPIDTFYDWFSFHHSHL
ncbi:hypothetical protein Pelo_8795 [Pelomyxa schiedti]|nr:hypothetical protein Pelo_8795 [Pelomyxa schiedti]